MKFPRFWPHKSRSLDKAPINWRDQIIKPASVLNVGGFRPSEEYLASCFGEIRAGRKTEVWPSYNGKPLIPICQLNLTNAPHLPDILSDIKMFQFFISDDGFWSSDTSVIDSSEAVPASPFFIRTYRKLDRLDPIEMPDIKTSLKSFEACWENNVAVDYPTHDMMPIDFDSLGIGDYYDQQDIDQIGRTKIGGWPTCIQSDPWWNYSANDHNLTHALTIDTEEKAKCHWGDGGVVNIARSKTNENLWAVDRQCS